MEYQREYQREIREILTMAGVSDEYKAKLRRRNASQLGDSNTLEQVVEAVDKDMQTMQTTEIPVVGM